MIYYYVTNSENYLKSTFEKFPEEYPELKNEYESFQFNTHFKPTTVVPEGNFVFLFDLILSTKPREDPDIILFDPEKLWEG